MTSILRRLGLFVLLLFAASPQGASAGLLTLTGSSLTVALPAFASTASVPQNVAALPILVSSGGGSFTEPAGLFTGTVVLPPALFTGVPLINGFVLAVSNRTKQIAQGAPGGGATTFGILRAGGGLGGQGPLTGTAIVNILNLFNLIIPLGYVGNTGAAYTSSPFPLPVSVIGTGWTTGDVTITGLTTETPSGGTTNTVTFAALGFDHRTPGHRGIVHLVSPFKVVSHLAGNVAGYAVQSLTFVPEPGTFLLLGAGMVALVAHGLSKRRR